VSCDAGASRLIVWVLGLFSFQTVYAVQSLLPQWMQDFHSSAAEVGATVAATVLAMALVSPWMGMFSDRVGRKPVIVAALLLLALPTALIATARGVGDIVVFRFLQGLAIPGISVVMMAYLGEEFQGKRVGQMIATFVSGSVLGGFLGRFVPGHLSEFFGWRTAFVVLGCANLLGALLVLWVLPASRHFHRQASVRGALSALRRHLRNPALLGACAVGFSALLAMVAGFTYVNVVLASPPFGLSPGALSNVFAVFLVGVVVTPLAGSVIQRVGYSRALLLAMSLGISGISLTLVPSLPVIVIGLVLASCATFFSQAASIGFIAANVDESRSLASGIYNMIYYLGAATGAWLGGVLFVAGGWKATVALIVCAQVAAVVIAHFAAEKARAPSDRTETAVVVNS
jgi:predicted MFS family arabinose efflux permease